MVSQLIRDIRQLVTGKEPVSSERMLMLVFGISGLVVSIAFIALLSSYRPTPVVRPAPRILPVTVEVAAPASLPAPRLIQVTAVPTVPPAAPADEMVEYPVKTGDTLIAIARRFCGDYLAIARDNQITDPNWIYADKTVLKFKNGCTHAPSVLVNRNVSPRELASDGEASSGKHIPKLVIRAPEAEPLPPVAAPAPAPSASQPIPAAAPAVAVAPSRPLSELRHREIYRIAALKRINPEERTRAENAELYRLQMKVRQDVLAWYKLPNPDCLYAKHGGKNWEEQTLSRVNCIRENYGAVIAEVAAEHELESSYIEAIIMAESEGQPDAISPTGCTGLKQFTIASSKLFGLTDRFDPIESIRAGGRHIKSNLRQWRGNVAKATAHYNIGSVVVGSADFNAAQFPYTQNVLRVKRLIEKESKRLASGQPGLVPVAYTPAR